MPRLFQQIILKIRWHVFIAPYIISKIYTHNLNHYNTSTHSVWQQQVCSDPVWMIRKGILFWSIAVGLHNFILKQLIWGVTSYVGLKALPVAPFCMWASWGTEQAGKKLLALSLVWSDSQQWNVYRGRKMWFKTTHPGVASVFNITYRKLSLETVGVGCFFSGVMTGVCFIDRCKSLAHSVNSLAFC